MATPAGSVRVAEPAVVALASTLVRIDARLQRPGLVGRAAELALLTEELDAAERGNGQTVVILGEPGVGKTRLLADFLALARRKSLILASRAYPLGTTSPFAVISDAIEDHLRTLAPADLERLAGARAADLAPVLPSLAAIAPPSPLEASRSRVLEGLTHLVHALATERTVILALDDLQLADPSTWEAFHHLARHTPRSRILQLALVRSTDLAVSPALVDLLGSLAQDWLARQLVLAPLDRSAVWELARRALAREDVPATLGEWLYSKSLGNPLYVMGYLQALVERGLALDAPAPSTVPDTLRQRVAVRVATLSPAAKSALEAAAVIGRRAGASDLGSIVATSGEALSSLLEELALRQLLVEEETPAGVVYDFTHPLVQEAVYEGIGALRRRAMHLAAARALAKQGRSSTAAAHYARGAEPGDQTAIEFILASARSAEARQAHHEAISHLQSAVRLAVEPQQRIQILDELAWQANEVNDFGAGIPALKELEMLLTGSDDLAARIRVHLRMASLLSSGAGDFSEAARQADLADRLAEKAGDAVLKVKALNERAWILGIGGDLSGQVRLARTALDEAQRLGEQEVEMHVLGSLGHAAVAAGEFGIGEESFRRGIEIARRRDDLGQVAWHGSQLAWSRAFQGEVDAALELDRRLREEIPEIHHPYLLEFEGFVKWFGGQWEEAARDSQGRTGAWSASGLTMRELWALGTAVACLAEMGRLPEAEALASRVQRRAGPEGFIWMTDWFRYARGILDLAAGRLEPARANFEAAARRLEGMGAHAFAPFPLLELTEIAAGGDLELAISAMARLEAVTARLPVWFGGLAALGRARVALARGLPKDAARHADAAVAILGESPFRFFAARAHEARGRIEAAGGEFDAAIGDLTLALAAYRQLPAPARAEAVLTQLDELGSPGRRAAASARGARSLSPRERSVAVLASQGLMAREIAERLFISERTVESHLANAYAKLGLASKRELIRRARELQLDGRS
jgi:DNA-binding NarL/FixJ family response regulator